MRKRMRFTRDGIYTTKGEPVVETKKYRFLQPALDDNGKYCIVDCWPVDENGNTHPGYSASPIPVLVSKIGYMIKHASMGE